MTKLEFISKLEDVFEVSRGELTLEADFHNLPNYDSLKLLDLIAMVDEELGVNLSPDKLNACTTIDQLIEYVGSDKFQ